MGFSFDVEAKRVTIYRVDVFVCRWFRERRSMGLARFGPSIGWMVLVGLDTAVSVLRLRILDGRMKGEAVERNWIRD